MYMYLVREEGPIREHLLGSELESVGDLIASHHLAQQHLGEGRGVKGER